MDIREALKKLEGVQTIDSIMSILNANRARAIYLVHRLRKEGYVKTLMATDRRRVYYISFENKLGGASYYEIINRNSPVKLVEPETHRTYGREVSLEETLVFALNSGKLRLVLASLALFGKIDDWPLLYRLAKANGIQRKVGALYDLSRKLMRTKRMDGRTKRRMMPRKGERYQYIIEGFGSSDYKAIEDKWKVYIPFNRADLEDYL